MVVQGNGVEPGPKSGVRDNHSGQDETADCEERRS